jgi:hypothetical protein
MDPDQVIITDTEKGTCWEQFEELARYVTAEEACTNIVGEKPACCTNPDPARSCTIICLDRSPIDLLDKIIDFEVDLTCKDLNQIISFSTDDECAYEFRSADINFASCWCGFAGSETLDACFLCGLDE